MSIPYLPVYPSAHGIYNPKFMPDTLESDNQRTKYFRYEDESMAKLRELLAPEQYKPVRVTYTTYLRSLLLCPHQHLLADLQHAWLADGIKSKSSRSS
jgi:hypothetical protein